MAQSYKALKEDFVSNLSGGSIWEINFVTAVAPVSSNSSCLASASLSIDRLMTGCCSALVRPTVTAGIFS